MGADDTVLPIFEQPAPAVPVQRSKKQEAEAKQVRYTRHAASPRSNCTVCLHELQQDRRTGVNVASYVRHAPDGDRFLCFLHKQEALHQDQLAGLVKNGSA